MGMDTRAIIVPVEDRLAHLGPNGEGCFDRQLWVVIMQAALGQACDDRQRERYGALWLVTAIDGRAGDLAAQPIRLSSSCIWYLRKAWR